MTELREFQDGEVVPGTRYRVLRLLGVGGMGSVYEVEHVELGKRFVLKALLRELARRQDLAQRLRNEWRALARLEHVNIVNVTDAGTSVSGVPYYVMERLDGDTLAVVLRQKRRLHVLDAVGVAASVLEALSAAHDIGIIHRDVKPANIFMVSGGGVKLLDFGIAKIADATSVVTARGLAVGTPRYMSPEQARGERVDGRSDLYATALILFEMITGVGPFDDALDANELLLAHLAREAPLLSTRVMGISAELERIVASMLAKDCRLRPPHARLAAQHLRDFAARQRMAAAPASDAATAQAIYRSALLAAAKRITPSPLHDSITRPEGTAKLAPARCDLTPSDSAPTRHMNRPPLPTPVTLSANTHEPFAIAAAPNTTYISAPLFDGSTTLEISALPPVTGSASAATLTDAATLTERQTSFALSVSPAGERPERTEMLGEYTPDPARDLPPTRTRVPLPDAARPISVTPPPVVDMARPTTPPPGSRVRTFGVVGGAIGLLVAVAAVAHGFGVRSANAPEQSAALALPAHRTEPPTQAQAPSSAASFPAATRPELPVPLPSTPASASGSAAAFSSATSLVDPKSAVPAPSSAPPLGKPQLFTETKRLNAYSLSGHVPSGPPGLGPFLRTAPFRKLGAQGPVQPEMPASGL